MALSAGYVGRETVTNLRRNALMSVAAVVTMAVGLFTAGSALLWQRGVDRQTSRWRGGVELSIFMQPAATDAQIDAVRQDLESAPEVKKATYVDRAAAMAEMKRFFASQPEVMETVSEQDVPPNFKVVPRRAEQIEAIGNRFATKQGVYKVTYAKKAIETLIKATSTKRNVSLIFAGLALASALLVILNTVRMAIFSRRREVAIMKLVGATNWFIRVPFMLEGMAQGLIGALLADVVLYAFRNQIMSFVNDAALSTLARLYATTSEVLTTSIILLLIGAITGAVSSALAVRRYLDV